MFISFAHLCHITLVPCVYCKLIKRGRLAAPPITPPPPLSPPVWVASLFDQTATRHLSLHLHSSFLAAGKLFGPKLGVEEGIVFRGRRKSTKAKLFSSVFRQLSTGIE